VVEADVAGDAADARRRRQALRRLRGNEGEDRTTGEVTEVELFVAVLGASNYTFAEATRTQQVPDFAGSIARALTFIGGVPNAIVPDQLKSAVTGACRYEPAIQRTTADLGRHYGTTILPARPKSPRDKAKVEAGVLVAERWLLARIRNETFMSLGALNDGRNTQPGMNALVFS
jgi:transposase